MSVVPKICCSRSKTLNTCSHLDDYLLLSVFRSSHLWGKKSFGPSPLHVPGPTSLWNGSGDRSLCTGHEIWGGVRNRVKQFTPSWPWSRVCGAVFLTRGYEWQAMHLMLQDPWARKQGPDYLSSTPSSSHPPFRRPFWLDSSFENKIQGLKKCV